MPALAVNWGCADSSMGSHSNPKPVNHMQYGFVSSEEDRLANKLHGSSFQRNGVQKLKRLSSACNGNIGDGIPQPRTTLYDSSKLRLHWAEKRGIGAGLCNMGNTCFLNSVLQCLTYTAPLAHHLTANEHRRSCHMNEFCMLCLLQDHLNKCATLRGQAFKPMKILNNLRNIAKCLTWGQQEDAHEFLRYVVDAMQRSCLAGANGLDKHSKETTFVHEAFGGYLRSQVRCLKCHHTSDTYDPFLDLSVEIKDVCTVEQALRKFVSSEILDIENAYKCERCKVKVSAQKHFTVHRTSNILTIHLKRFDMNRMLGAKVSRHIKFSHELNIRPYMSVAQGEAINYVLYGVLVHSGFSCNTGHYYSYVRAPNGQWYCMNDSSVTTTSLSTVLSAEAYILFYIRTERRGIHNRPKPPHTITQSDSSHCSSVDLMNGSGDHAATRNIIGPQLPPETRLAKPANNTFKAYNSKFVIRTSAAKANGSFNRLTVTPRDKNVPQAKVTVPSLVPYVPQAKVTVPSLVPYAEQNSDDETTSQDKQEDGDSTSARAADKSGRLSLSEYTSRQGSRAGETLSNGADDLVSTKPVSTPRFTPRTVNVRQGDTNVKVLQLWREISDTKTSIDSNSTGLSTRQASCATCKLTVSLDCLCQPENGDTESKNRNVHLETANCIDMSNGDVDTLNGNTETVSGHAANDKAQPQINEHNLLEHKETKIRHGNCSEQLLPEPECSRGCNSPADSAPQQTTPSRMVDGVHRDVVSREQPNGAGVAHELGEEASFPILGHKHAKSPRRDTPRSYRRRDGSTSPRRRETRSPRCKDSDRSRSPSRKDSSYSRSSRHKRSISPWHRDSRSPRCTDSRSSRRRDLRSLRRRDSRSPRRRDSRSPRRRDSASPRCRDSRSPRHRESRSPRYRDSRWSLRRKDSRQDRSPSHRRSRSSKHKRTNGCNFGRSRNQDVCRSPSPHSPPKESKSRSRSPSDRIVDRWSTPDRQSHNRKRHSSSPRPKRDLKKKRKESDELMRPLLEDSVDKEDDYQWVEVTKDYISQHSSRSTGCRDSRTRENTNGATQKIYHKPLNKLSELKDRFMRKWRH